MIGTVTIGKTIRHEYPQMQDSLHTVVPVIISHKYKRREGPLIGLTKRRIWKYEQKAKLKAKELHDEVSRESENVNIKLTIKNEVKRKQSKQLLEKKRQCKCIREMH